MADYHLLSRYQCARFFFFFCPFLQHSNNINQFALFFSGYINKGYVASDVSSKGCSETLEYAYDDWALGNFAQALGKTQDAAMFLARSKNYKALLLYLSHIP